MRAKWGCLLAVVLLATACGRRRGDDDAAGDGDADADADADADSDADTDGDADDFLAIVLEAADVERTCTMVAACGYGGALGEASTCSTRLAAAVANGGRDYSHELVFRVVACARAHADCDAFLECATFGADLRACAPSSCDGNVAVSCGSDGQPAYLDCAALSGACDVDACVTGQECSGEIEDQARCDGWRGIVCVEGRELIDECPPGTTCGVIDSPAGPWPVCRPTGGACDVDECAGGVWRYCDADTGVGLEADCAAAEQRCEAGTGCVPAAEDCESGTPASCSGDSVVACINGREVSIACSDHGRSTCGEGPLGTLACE